MGNTMTIKDRLLASYPFICQAYDDAASATQFCVERNLTLLGMIEVDPAVTARIKSDESGPLAFLGHVLPPDLNSWGDFIYNPETKTVDICVRGTGDLLEWDADFVARLVPCRYLPGGMCHEGMQLVFDCIVGSIRRLAAKIPEETVAIRIHGHSLGCSLAELIALCLLPCQPPIEVYLWEPPRMFNPATAAAWNKLFPNTLAVKNEHDLVVTLPPRWLGFGDVGRDVWVEGGWKWNDVKIAHHLETGPGPGVQKMAP